MERGSAGHARRRADKAMPVSGLGGVSPRL